MLHGLGDCSPSLNCGCMQGPQGQSVNEARKWPDWRTMSPDKAIEHVREAEDPVAAC